MNTLFILAHADDEYFCQPLIANELAGGRLPHFVYMTDGAWGEATARQRCEESLTRLSSLGVPKSHVHFPGVEASIAVGKLHERLQVGRRALSECVSRIGAVDRAYVCAWEGGHHDHDSCFALAVTDAGLARAACEIMQFPLYNGCRRRGPLFSCLSPLSENGEPKPAVRFELLDGFKWWLSATAYPSQWRSWLGIVPMATTAMLLKRTQWVQPCSRARLRERPHAGRLYYERRFGVEYADVAAAVAEL